MGRQAVSLPPHVFWRIPSGGQDHRCDWLPRSCAVRGTRRTRAARGTGARNAAPVRGAGDPRGMKVLALCGSLRRVSMNGRLLRAAARLAPEGMQLRVFDGLGLLPLFNPDLDGADAQVPAPVARLREAIDANEAMLIASPEYA